MAKCFADNELRSGSVAIPVCSEHFAISLMKSIFGKGRALKPIWIENPLQRAV
jgi:hypothetical protein